MLLCFNDRDSEPSEYSIASRICHRFSQLQQPIRDKFTLDIAEDYQQLKTPTRDNLSLHLAHTYFDVWQGLF